MSKPRVVIIRAPGINCEEETRRAWQLAGADSEIVHLNRLIEQPACLDGYDILTLPGGFSFGDDIAAGRILAIRMMNSLADRLRAFVERDGLILGICNGFQSLVKAGLLNANDIGDRCTLTVNANGCFVCRWVTVKSPSDRCRFLEKDRAYFLPIAHAEGRFVVTDPATFDRSRVALRYVEGTTRIGGTNPNGSFEDIAALTDSTGRILGIMPHPERFIDPIQHPFRTAANAIPKPDGLALFRTAVEQFR